MESVVPVRFNNSCHVCTSDTNGPMCTSYSILTGETGQTFPSVAAGRELLSGNKRAVRAPLIQIYRCHVTARPFRIGVSVIQSSRAQCSEHVASGVRGEHKGNLQLNTRQ